MKFLRQLFQRARQTGGATGPLANLELFRRVFDHSPIPIVLVALHGDKRVLEANTAAISAFGFEERNPVGLPLEQLGIFIDPTDQARYREQLLRTGSITGFEMMLRTQQGRTVDVLLSGSVVTVDGEPCSINFLLDLTGRKAAETALAQSEAKFHRVFDQSPAIIALLTVPEGRVIDINAAGLVAFGYAREELVGRTTAELDIWADAADREAYLRQLTDTGRVDMMETRMRRKDGRILTVINSGSFIRIGDQTWSMNTTQDITDRKRAEATQEQTTSLARATLESTADGILAVDAAGRIESFNRVFTEMWGLPEDILASRDDERAIARVLGQLRDPQAFLDKVRHLYAHPDEESFDTLEFIDGRVFERYSRPMLVNGLASGRVWSFRDISLRRVAEAALRASEEKFRGVFDKSPVIMGLLTVPEGRFVEVNEAGVAAFGHARDEAIGRTSGDLGIWADEGQRQRYLALLQAHGTVSSFEAEMRRKDGSTFIALYSGSLIRIGGATYSLNSLQDITPRKRAEEALRASEQRYERVVQNISDALLIDDREGRVVFANARFRQLYGLPPGADVRQLRLEDYVAPDSHAELRDRHERRVRGEAVPDHFIYEAQRADRTRFWVEVNVTPTIVDGVITGTQSLNRDITDRRITEQAMLLLSTGTATLRGQPFYEHIATEAARLFDADQGLIALHDRPQPDRVRTLGICLDGRVLPPAEYALAGTPCGTVSAQGCVVYPAGVAALFPAAGFLRDLGMEGYAAAPLRNPAGEVMGHVAILSRRPLRHSATLLESVLQMIAFKVAAEIGHEQAESKFHDLFAFSPDAIFIATQQGVITDANQRALEMFGYTHAELTGLAVGELIPPDVRDEMLQRLSLYLAHPVPRAMGTSAPGLFALSKAGRRFPIDISLSPLHSDHGLLVVAAIRDTTTQVRAAEQRQQIEAQLRQAQKMESLGTLAGGIAHDFNNILTGMLGFIELMHVDLPADHPAQQWVQSLSASGDRAKNLVRQILTFSRKQEGERVPLRLTAVAEEAIRLLRATMPAMINLETDFPPSCPPVMADSNQMHQIIVNLCTNAWHALPARDGRIRVTLDTCELPLAGSGPAQPLQPPGPYVRLTVTDNGAGMDPHTLERIFDPFFTTKKTGEGTGLGLAVVHGIVVAHDGFIKVRSAPGEGSVFEVFFPALSSTAPARPAAVVPHGPRGSGESILLVDDDLASGKAITGLLDWLGYNVTLHHTPLAALEAFRIAPADFALVISDLAMPGLTGIQFARQIRELNPAVPLLIISGFVTPAQQQELRDLGIPDLLRKPPTLDDLTLAVARSLGRNPAG